MVDDNSTIYEMERTGLTKNQWSQRKSALRGHGLKPGDWFTIRPNFPSMKDIRPGMTIQNKRHENIIYRVIKTDENVRSGLNMNVNCILVIETKYNGLDWEQRSKHIKEIISLSQFRLVIS